MVVSQSIECLTHIEWRVKVWSPERPVQSMPPTKGFLFRFRSLGAGVGGVSLGGKLGVSLPLTKPSLPLTKPSGGGGDHVAAAAAVTLGVS